VLSAARSGAGLAHRLAAGAVSVALGALLLLTLSRGGILVTVAVLAVLAVLLLARTRSAGVAAAALAVCACLCIAVGTSAPARSSVLGALTGSSTALTTPTGGQAISDPSLDDRRAAIRKGLDVARDHLPLGVGPDQLARYSPRYHAAHSLPVQVLAEDGLLGLAGLLLVAAFLVVTLVDLLRRFGETAEELALARLAAVAGAGAYLLQGAIVGVPLALGQDMVWAALLAVLVGVAAALHGRGREPARA
jgi:O-Antigen ligase